MSNSKLNSDTFGENLYNHFPPKYREEDEFQNYALKRYLQAIVEGGFEYSISEWNGILDLVNPETCDVNILPILFQQFGLEIFNGLPEDYLRFLLPNLSSAWEHKGTTEVLSYIISSLSGIRVNVTPVVDPSGNTTIEVRLEMDYNSSGYFPDSVQFSRIITKFIPFTCDNALIYSYLFTETADLSMIDSGLYDKVVSTLNDLGTLNSTDVDNGSSITISPIPETGKLDSNLNYVRLALVTNMEDRVLNEALIIIPSLFDTVTNISTGVVDLYIDGILIPSTTTVDGSILTEDGMSLTTEDGIPIVIE